MDLLFSFVLLPVLPHYKTPTILIDLQERTWKKKSVRFEMVLYATSSKTDTRFSILQIQVIFLNENPMLG